MRIIAIIVYVLIGIFLAWFAANNWTRAELVLPGGYAANWPLAAYLILAFLLGAIPVSFLHSVSRWRLNRRVRKLEAARADDLAAADVSTPSEARTYTPPPASEPLRPL